MKINYKKIAPTVFLVGSAGLLSLIGCISTQGISENDVKRKLNVQRIEDIDNYPNGYRASWRSKGAIREALGKYAPRFNTYSETVSNVLKDMDLNGDRLITDYEANNLNK